MNRNENADFIWLFWRYFPTVEIFHLNQTKHMFLECLFEKSINCNIWKIDLYFREIRRP